MPRHTQIWEKVTRAVERLRLEGHPAVVGLTKEGAIHWFTRNSDTGRELLRQYREAIGEAIRQVSDEPVTVKQDVDPFSAYETRAYKTLRSLAESLHENDRARYPSVAQAYAEIRKQRPDLVRLHNAQLLEL